MIKTVSFAPPRSSHSRSLVRPTPAKPASNPVLSLDAAPAPSEGATPHHSAKTKMKKASAKAPGEVSLDLFGAPDEPLAMPVVAPKPPIKAKSTKNEGEISFDSTKNEAKPETEVEPVKNPAEIKAKTEVKAKKVRVPKDLAAQYGEKTANRPVAPPPLETESPKKRLNKAERQARRDLMKPSESLMERLARANQISVRKPASEPRGKGWKFVCGRCGAISYFQTPGGLCGCGTIAVKE